MSNEYQRVAQVEMFTEVRRTKEPESLFAPTENTEVVFENYANLANL
jgi:hypothetical protein